MIDPIQEERWQKTARLALVTVAGGCGAAVFLATLSQAIAGEAGFPLAHLLAIMALPIVPTAVVFWFTRRQDMIDRQYGEYED